MKNDILGNLSRSELLRLLEENLGQDRFFHVLRVEDMALELCNRHGADIIKCRTAALYHDLAKNFSLDQAMLVLDQYLYKPDPIEEGNMNLLHSKVAGLLAENHYGVKDKETIEAILFHTTGKPDMSTVSKIVFLADALERGRIYKSVEGYRDMANENLDSALLEVLNGQIIYLIRKKSKIHPDAVQARNFLLS